MDERDAETASGEGHSIPMRWTFDGRHDVGYLYFTAIRPGEAKYQYVCDAPYIGGDIVLDFSDDGRLLGIEFISPTQLLPLDLVEQLSSADVDKQDDSKAGG
jgi:uncharacterized protein YuzE